MSNMYKLTLSALVLLVSALSLVNAGPVAKAIPCGGSGTFVNLTVIGCDGTERCSVPIGQAQPVQISFASAGTTDQVQFQVWFYRPFGSVSPILNVPLEGVSLVPDTEYSFTQEVTVPDRFLDVEGEFDVVLVDLVTDTQIICGEVLVKITAATQTS